MLKPFEKNFTRLIKACKTCNVNESHRFSEMVIITKANQERITLSCYNRINFMM